jgi:DNA repair exonuclease SbcCD ATPase subunit
MKIKNLSIENFGVLSSKKIAFSEENINIILGENETGKSTLCSAILAILYGFSNKNEADMRRSWGSSSDYRGILQIGIQYKDYIIERDFINNHVKLTCGIKKANQEILFDGDANPKGRTEQPRAYRKLIDNLGFPPETVFRSAVYIGQLELEIEINDELRQQLSGAGKADYLKALEELRKDYYSLTRQGLSGDSPKRVDKKCEEARAKKQTLIDEYERACSHSSELAEVERELEESTRHSDELKNRMVEVNTEKKVLDDYLAWLKERDSLNQQIKLKNQQKEQVERLQKDIQEIEHQLSGERYSALNFLPEPDLQALEYYVQSDAEETIREIQKGFDQEKLIIADLNDNKFMGFSDAPDNAGAILEKIIEEKKSLDDYEKQTAFIRQETKKPSLLLPILLLGGLGLLGAVAGAIVSSFLHINMIIGIAIGLLIFCCIAGILIAFLLTNQTRKFHDGEKKRLDVQAQLDEKRLSFQVLLKRIEPIIQANRDTDIVFEILVERWTQYQQIRQRLISVQERRKILSERDVFKIRDDPKLKPIIESAPAVSLRDRLKDFRALKTKLDVNKENLQNNDTIPASVTTDENPDNRFRELVILIDELGKKHPDFVTFQTDRRAGGLRQSSLQKELASLLAEMDTLANKIRSLQVLQGQLQISFYRNPLLIQEDIQSIDTEIQRLEVRISALKTAIETLSEAISEYEENHLSRLSKWVSAYFAKFTNGHYKQVEIVPGEQPKISVNKGVIIEPGLLSTGAKDQLFFALRLAIADILSSELSLPLILDDTFVNFDETRLGIVHEVLEKIVESRQIILLSHNPDYKNWSGHLINI